MAIPPVAKRVGDHIFRYFPHSAVLLVDNKKLEEAVKGKSRDPVVQVHYAIAEHFSFELVWHQGCVVQTQEGPKSLETFHEDL
ncbi:unnamed protein product [Miscanthus lutarioriparius]|uniref:Uncharacterized protein n=1 Tax=Miscanthus lutarioriparius TaxID=422564 RepID=A0A811P4I6_9POAL|nr:unnamed protein product [Miscanthus lutarioriparius]